MSRSSNETSDWEYCKQRITIWNLVRLGPQLVQLYVYLDLAQPYSRRKEREVNGISSANLTSRHAIFALIGMTVQRVCVASSNGRTGSDAACLVSLPHIDCQITHAAPEEENLVTPFVCSGLKKHGQRQYHSSVSVLMKRPCISKKEFFEARQLTWRGDLERYLW